MDGEVVTVRNPEVSVILPVYNPGPGLTDSLARLDSTLVEFAEVIIVDDGSSDGTAEVLQNYADGRTDVNLVLLEKNSGVAHARNNALQVARGDYVWFVDWDDQWDESIIARMLHQARKTDADVVVCRADWRLASGLSIGPADGVDHEVVIDGPSAFDLVLRGKIKGYLWSKLLRRTLLADDMFPRMGSQSDFCGLIPMLARANSVAMISDSLYSHVIRDGSITNSSNPRLQNLTLCKEVVHTVAESLPPTVERSRLLMFYDCVYWHLATINTALRLSDPLQARAVVKSEVRALKYREIVALRSISLPTCTRLLLTKAFGRGYPITRRAVVWSRSRIRTLRRLRNPVSQRGVGAPVVDGLEDCN